MTKTGDAAREATSELRQVAPGWLSQSMKRAGDLKRLHAKLAAGELSSFEQQQLAALLCLAPEQPSAGQAAGEVSGLAMLGRDYAKLRKVGSDLAEAAVYTVGERDGLHRLSLAAAAWSTAIANEGDRDLRHGAQPKPVASLDREAVFREGWDAALLNEHRIWPLTQDEAWRRTAHGPAQTQSSLPKADETQGEGWNDDRPDHPSDDPLNLRGSCEDPRLRSAGYYVCSSHGVRDWHWKGPDGVWHDSYRSESAAVNAALRDLAAALPASPDTQAVDHG